MDRIAVAAKEAFWEACQTSRVGSEVIVVNEDNMELLEAYKHTLNAAGDLRVDGIKTEITQSRSDHDQEENGLPKSMWVQVVFHPADQAQVAAINKALDELGWACIVFDTSGHLGQRQWDIDWSFKVGDTPDGEWEASRRDLEDMIDGAGTAESHQ